MSTDFNIELNHRTYNTLVGHLIQCPQTTPLVLLVMLPVRLDRPVDLGTLTEFGP